MCGIFGGIGPNVNPLIIRMLAIANRERGSQSLGLFDSSGKAVKAGRDPMSALTFAEFNAFIGNAERWFIAGHTRHATHGVISDSNAHPFRFGRIIGAHNGVVRYPYNRGYHVDSEFLFDQLHRHNGNYQAGLADIDGYWGLSWFDGEHFYLQAHGNSIAVGLADDGNYYYSSDEAHLAACIGGADKMCVLDKGRTIRFTGPDTNPDMMPDFVSNVKTSWDRYSWRKGLQAAAPAGELAASSANLGTESKADRKRRKRRERKAARLAEQSAISWDDYDMGNELAQEAGYRDLGDFMWLEGITSEYKAIRMLEDSGYETQHSLWNENDDKVVIADFDSIPF